MRNQMSTKVVAVMDALRGDAGGAGWNLHVGAGFRDADDYLWTPGVQGTPTTDGWVKFERTEDGVTATVVLNVTVAEKATKYYKPLTYAKGVTVEGHTFVNGRSFTRRGVDANSCSLISDKKRVLGNDCADLATLLAGQWERCVAADAKRKTAVSVPGTPFTRQPEWFAQATADLKSGRSVSLAPHGMGTGYTLHAPRSVKGLAFADRAPAALEAKLGVSPIYITQFDHD